MYDIKNSINDQTTKNHVLKEIKRTRYMMNINIVQKITKIIITWYEFRFIVECIYPRKDQ